MKKYLAAQLDRISEWLLPKEKVESTTFELIERILDRPIEWVRWNELGEDDRRAWGSEARALLDNRAFKSLCGYTKPDGTKVNGELVKVIMETCFRYADDYTKVRDARMIVSGIERIKEEAEGMLFKEHKELTDDIFSAI